MSADNYQRGAGKGQWPTGIDPVTDCDDPVGDCDDPVGDCHDPVTDCDGPVVDWVQPSGRLGSTHKKLSEFGSAKENMNGFM